MKTIFEKIIDGDLPAEKVFENDRLLVIKDIHPQAPIHLLIISKKVIPKLQEASSDDQELLGEILLVAKQMAARFGVENSYRLLTNNGPDAGQTIFHLHFHLIGGKKLGPMA